MTRFRIGNCLRGWHDFEAPSEAEAWEYGRRLFMQAFPSDNHDFHPYGTYLGRDVTLSRSMVTAVHAATSLNSVVPCWVDVLHAQCGQPFDPSWYDQMRHLR